jgi:hypothetical protein
MSPGRRTVWACPIDGARIPHAAKAKRKRERNKFLILKIFFTQKLSKIIFNKNRIGALWSRSFFTEAFFS